MHIPALLSRPIRRLIPRVARRWLARQLRGPDAAPPVGDVRLGELRRLQPISDRFGYDRGLPIDRYYIEAFLAEHRADVRGRVLEIGDDTYTVRFGEGRVRQADVLHVSADNPRATFVGDLADGAGLPSAAFDCVILTQTLHLIYDFRGAVDVLHRILAPGGVLLLTVPGITRISGDEWGHAWFWAFTGQSVRRLLGERFGEQPVAVHSTGNVLAASAFLYGLAAEELSEAELAHRDPAFEVAILARAVKQ